MSLAEIMAGMGRLVACGNDELWYEDLTVANGVMTKLTASGDGQIDTSDNLTMFEAFGKAIILNGGNKKVVDFVNTKITTDNVGPNPPDFGMELEDMTSHAKMYVDYVTSLSGECTLYGYRSTEEKTFDNGHTVTGVNSDGKTVSFTLTANEVTPGPGVDPHWYDLTPFGKNANFGSLPTKLYLGCLWLSRMYVAGDPAIPYGWAASRQGNIWDWLYNQDDVQSPVTGGDVEVGKIQDIIRALIPVGNDYLIFGCASSMYVMSGDPMQGGTLKQIDGTSSIFGSRSWCLDEFGSLYYYGTGGIYRIQKGLASVEHLTEYRLPRIIHDEGANPFTHRITMEYDLKRHGLQIGIVNLETRENSCYWYERRTDGFYPERYPQACAPYSMLYYNSAVPAQRDLLIGCSDGYIRRPDDADEDDDVGGSDEAVDSYITLGPFQLGRVLGEDGLIGNVYGIMGENQSVDCSSVMYYVYTGDTPEAVMKAVKAGNHAMSGTVYAPGYRRGGKQRRQVRGKYAAIRLRNNAANQTWAFEEIEVEIAPAGNLA